MASKSKRNKVKFKWTKELVILIVCLVAVLVATIVLAIPSGSSKLTTKLNETIEQYNSDNSTSYSTLLTDNVFDEVDAWTYSSEVKKVKSIAEDNDGYTYFYYGSLTDGDYLNNLSSITTLAEDYEIEKVYLFYADYVTEAKEAEETDTATYKQTINEYEKILNADLDTDLNPNVEKIDMTETNSIFVYKAGKLVFNTQVGNDSDQYSWAIYLQKAFSFEMNEKATSSTESN